jgi:hypothetical protein
MNEDIQADLSKSPSVAIECFNPKRARKIQVAHFPNERLFRFGPIQVNFFTPVGPDSDAVFVDRNNTGVCEIRISSPFRIIRGGGAWAPSGNTRPALPKIFLGPNPDTCRFEVKTITTRKEVRILTLDVHYEG